LQSGRRPEGRIAATIRAVVLSHPERHVAIARNPGVAGGACLRTARCSRAANAAFVGIPIDFSHPTAKDFDAFASALSGQAGRKVLVHCQVNMRASTMVFHYRTIVAKEDPQRAYEAVIKVWVPEGPWKGLIRDELRQHNIDFEPYCIRLRPAR
jgi:hypothetical protein